MSVFAARSLTLNDLGTYSIIISVYLLSLSVFISCVGEAQIIWNPKDLNNEVLRSNFGFSFYTTIFLFLLISLISIPLFLMPLNLMVLDLFFVSLTMLIIMMAQNYRYFFHSIDMPQDAAMSGLSLTIGTMMWLLFSPDFLNLNPAVEIFISFGAGGLLAIILSIHKAPMNFSLKNWYKLFLARIAFIRKAGILNFSIWASGNLHWIILGVYFNQGLLGIIRGCLTIISPMQNLERGFSNSFLTQLNKSPLSRIRKLFNIYFISISFIYLIVVIFWLLNSDIILKYTIGEKFLEYKVAISLLMFIPIFQSISAFVSLILKSFSIFIPQILVYTISPLLMFLLIYFNSNSMNPLNIVIGMLLIALMQSFLVYIYYRFFFISGIKSSD